MEGAQRATSRRAAAAAWATVLLACGFVVAARWPLLAWPPGPDEAGYLLVGAQWGPGTSLYGNYWVDRPPLLVGLCGLAESVGGLDALRHLGTLAAVLVVLAVAWTVNAAVGPRTADRAGAPEAARAALAAAVAAVVAAALVVSPALGAYVVNGELLAAPFVATGIGAAVHAVRAPTARRTHGWALLAGAAGAAAVMVKQNMVDVFVFGAVLLLACLASRRLRWSAVARIVVAATAGALATLLAMLAWTVHRGTDLTDLWYALYPFRLDASRTILDGGTNEVLRRRDVLVRRWFLGGPGLVSVWVLAAAAWLRAREPVLLGVLAVLAYDLASIVVGGGYWAHYLVQTAVPLAVGFGVVAGRVTGWRHALTVLTAGSVVAASCLSLARSADRAPQDTSEQVGTAVARVAEAGDTLTVVYGGARINRAAGLPSPYPHLWGLPLRTLDPDLDLLTSVLLGPDAPTWVVVSSRFDMREVDGEEVRRALAARYDRVAVVQGQRIFLRHGVTRRAPAAGGAGCRSGATSCSPR